MHSILARAVVIERERLLVARCKGWSHVFLPGGHVESGEPLHECLKRELREELGVDSHVGKYLGSLPHTWEKGEALIFETNHCFIVSLAEHEFTSKEEHIEFFWLPLSKIPSTDLRPPALRSLIPKLIHGDSSQWEVSRTEASEAPTNRPD